MTPAVLTAEELIEIAARGRCVCGHLAVMHQWENNWPCQHVYRDCPCFSFTAEPDPEPA